MLRLIAVPVLTLLTLAIGAAWLFVVIGTIWIFVPILVAAGIAVAVMRLVGITLVPGSVTTLMGLLVLTAAILGLLTLIFAQFGRGLLTVDDDIGEIESLVAGSRAIEVLNAKGMPIGILPASLDPDRTNAPYLAIDIRPDQVPPVFADCLVWLEDRDLGAWWHVYGVDLYRVSQSVAWVLPSVVLKKGRRGGSGIAEMVERSLRNKLPKRRASFFAEFARKLASYQRLPAIAAIFPTDAELIRAAGVHLPLMVGAKDSGWGSEVHGVALAASVLGKSLTELTVAEQALFAASVNLPVRIGTNIDPATEDTWIKARHRAGRCLAQATFDQEIDRDKAIKALSTIRPVTSSTRSPATLAIQRLNGQGAAVVREVAAIAGLDWRKSARNIQLNLQNNDDNFLAVFRDSVREVERKNAGKFAVPLWPDPKTPNSALIYGAVADADGNIVTSVSNSDFDVINVSLPLGSIAKIPGALAIAKSGLKADRLTGIFARSDSRAVERVLARLSDSDVAKSFEALGWTRPLDQSARRHAAYGAVEVKVADVLCSSIGLTDLLKGDRNAPVVMQGLVKAVQTVTDERLEPTTKSFDVSALKSVLNGETRARASVLLASPLGRNGTMRAVGRFIAQEGGTAIWGKSGTADTGAGGFGVSPTRTLWHVGGFSHGGRKLTFVVVVTSRDARNPLGFVQSPAIAPLTIALLKQAISNGRRHLVSREEEP